MTNKIKSPEKLQTSVILDQMNLFIAIPSTTQHPYFVVFVLHVREERLF